MCSTAGQVVHRPASKALARSIINAKLLIMEREREREESGESVEWDLVEGGGELGGQSVRWLKGDPWCRLISYLVNMLSSRFGGMIHSEIETAG